MNELFFLFQIFCMLGFTALAFRMGREALIACTGLFALLSNLFVLKQIDLFGLHVTASDGFAVACLLSLNLLREYWGKESANQGAKLSLLFLLFFAFAAQFQLRFQPNTFDVSHQAYSQLLNPSMRLFLASLISFAVTQVIDLKLFTALTQKWPQLPFATRSTSSLLIVQLLDTLLFSFLGIYGLVGSLTGIIIFSLGIKWLTILLLIPFSMWVRKIKRVA